MVVLDLCDGIEYCEMVCDYVICDLFWEIFVFEEEYIDWLEIQFGLIDWVGLENYL